MVYSPSSYRDSLGRFFRRLTGRTKLRRAMNTSCLLGVKRVFELKGNVSFVIFKYDGRKPDINYNVMSETRGPRLTAGCMKGECSTFRHSGLSKERCELSDNMYTVP